MMRRTIQVVDELASKGVIGKYAIAGAVAAIYYIEPTLTDDLDILISVDTFDRKRSGLLTIEPLLRALENAGYSEFRKEGVVIEGWPVQFLPVSSALDEEALEQAIEVDLDVGGSAIRTRVLRAEHVVATAVKLGRAKDFARVAEFLERGAVDPAALGAVISRHGLARAWAAFCRKTGTANPLVTE